MPWREHRRVDLREQFVLKASEPRANISELSRDFGISRKTAYFWLKRFKAEGVVGLQERSHRPRRLTGISGDVVLRISELHRQYPRWGPKKLQALLRADLGTAPAVRTIARIWKRLGFAPLRQTRRRKPTPYRDRGALGATKPNEVWTFDFKGWWNTRDGARFEPLTVRDAASRYVFLCAHTRTTHDAVKARCTQLFRQYGLPARIRVDNGSPFAASDALGGLSRLSAWWVSLGIEVTFSRPGTPGDNGAHERLHVDIASELQAEPAATIAAQQLLVDDWVRDFNHRRPHEALQMKTPASVYRRSKRRMKTLTPSYPSDATVHRVSARGRVRLDGYQYFVGTNLSGMHIGIRQDGEKKTVLFFGEVLGPLESTPQRAR